MQRFFQFECIFLPGLAIIGISTKEKFLNTYPPLFSPLPVGFVQQAGDFLYNRKLRSLLYKNAPLGSHWVGKEKSLLQQLYSRRRREFRENLRRQESSVLIFR
ncbi:hypothetical protein CLOM621_06388 [Clostridium sp. M62/1]|nr:hypothetical protein CLOM621_06388 [Clostridium sp. M62/1]